MDLWSQGTRWVVRVHTASSVFGKPLHHAYVNLKRDPNTTFQTSIYWEKYTWHSSLFLSLFSVVQPTQIFDISKKKKKKKDDVVKPIFTWNNSFHLAKYVKVNFYNF